MLRMKSMKLRQFSRFMWVSSAVGRAAWSKLAYGALLLIVWKVGPMAEYLGSNCYGSTGFVMFPILIDWFAGPNI